MLFLRERERMRARKGQKERETQNPKQAPASEPSAQNLTRGLNSQTARSWPEPKLWMPNWLSHPGAPRGCHLMSQKTLWEEQVWGWTITSANLDMLRLRYIWDIQANHLPNNSVQHSPQQKRFCIPNMVIYVDGWHSILQFIRENMDLPSLRLLYYNLSFSQFHYLDTLMNI